MKREEYRKIHQVKITGQPVLGVLREEDKDQAGHQETGEETEKRTDAADRGDGRSEKSER